MALVSLAKSLRDVNSHLSRTYERNNTTPPEDLHTEISTQRHENIAGESWSQNPDFKELGKTKLPVGTIATSPPQLGENPQNY